MINGGLRFSLSDLNRALFAAAVILIPFNSLPYLKELLREMANEGAFYPLLIALFVWGVTLLRGMKLTLPTHISARFLILFVAWIVLSGVANYANILVMVTKGRLGAEKYLAQVALTLFVMLSALLVYQIAVRSPDFLVRFRRYVLLSFLVAGAYSLAEIAFLSGNETGTAIMDTIDQYIRSNESPFRYIGRLRSVSGEASWFAMYCSLIFPWIMSYVFTERRRRAAYVAMVLYLFMLIVLTWSRTAYVITSVQLALFMFGVFSNADYRRKSGYVIILLGLIAVMLIGTPILFSEYVFGEHGIIDIFSTLFDLDDMSNVGRLGSQVAAYAMALDNPVFGVGWGQYGFHMPQYVPDWARGSIEIHEWMSSSVDTTWAPVHAIYARIAAELGFVGLTVWLGVWITLLLACYRRHRARLSTSSDKDILGLALVVSMIGVLLNGLNVDTLRFFGYWIILGIAWAYIRNSPETRRLGAGR